jgi:hypothetical protein
MSDKYVLVDGKPVKIEDPIEWARKFNSSQRIVIQTQVGESFISTVFLGLDHDFTGKGPPILWETMVFGGPLADDEERYTSEKLARDGHERMVSRVKYAGKDRKAKK